MPSKRFPWWIFLGAVVIGCGWLPTLNTRFDFIDDGNLVYPAPPETTLSGYVDRWWERVDANVEHLGPFRPVLWAHWELQANLLGADSNAWRAVRLFWCMLSCGMLLWLLRELNFSSSAALVATAAAMWNPYRNEIWTSLTLAEGTAMPYALLTLVAARRAARLSAQCKPAWIWDLTSILALVAALGCKNTFAALVPAQLVLRLWFDSDTWSDGWRRNRVRAGLSLLPLLIPIGHFVYFKLNWKPGHYTTPGPSLAQFSRIFCWLKGASGIEFLGAAALLTFVSILGAQRTHSILIVRAVLSRHKAAVLAGALLFVAGVVVYLPLNIMAPRYTMPAVWGVDLFAAICVTMLIALRTTTWTRLAKAGIFAGLAIMATANFARQEKCAARSALLWSALEQVERTAPPNAVIEWRSGDTGMLNAEEGIHFRWHLLNRGRGDILVQLVDEQGVAIERVEIPKPKSTPTLRLTMESNPPDPKNWRTEATFVATYRLGCKQLSCRLDQAVPHYDVPLQIDPYTAELMQSAFIAPNNDAAFLRALTKQPVTSDGSAMRSDVKAPAKSE